MQPSQAANVHAQARNRATIQSPHPETLSVLEERKIEADILNEV
jgi:hypothetical protein